MAREPVGAPGASPAPTDDATTMMTSAARESERGTAGTAPSKAVAATRNAADATLPANTQARRNEVMIPDPAGRAGDAHRR